MKYFWVGLLSASFWGMASTAYAQELFPPSPSAPAPSAPAPSPPVPASPADRLDLPPEVLENSPVLQRWSEEVPNVLSEIRNDPSFRTRLRVGYSQFPSSEQAAGIHVGVEDIFVGRSHATLSADYQAALNGDRTAYGAELRYYALPLGNSINIAPVVGYRRMESDNYNTDGLNVGVRLQLQLSRTGAADIALSQTWVNPGSDSEEVGLTTLTFGYALTDHLRISTDLQKQNAPQQKDSRVGIGLEWML